MTDYKGKNGSVLGVPPGADFVKNLYDVICDHETVGSPEALSQIHVLVPSRRMQRRLRDLFEQGPPRLLPKIGLVTDVSNLLPGEPQISAVSATRRTLELKTAVSRLVELDPRLSQNDVIELTSSLTRLLDEMHGEGVTFDQLEALSPGDQSGHWQQSLAFLRAIRGYVEALGDEETDAEAAHRASVEKVLHRWQTHPPEAPVIVAGSTGSRATTQMLMCAVSRLPSGTVVLPGFDFDLTSEVWASLGEDRQHEDHPQYRFATFLKEVDLAPDQVVPLGQAPNTDRNKLVSLSLRPAPVTDKWLELGPKLGPLMPATKDMVLIEARDPKQEAAALAAAIRIEVGKNRSVALISPDATLARRVGAELKRWGIIPDDSGGTPLSLTPEGRFLRQTARVAAGHRDPVEIVALLKHPLTQAGDDRGETMRHIQEFELFLRRKGFDRIDRGTVDAFFDSDQREQTWLSRSLDLPAAATDTTLRACLDRHLDVIDRFAGPEGVEKLFSSDAGQKAKAILDDFSDNSEIGVEVTFSEYIQLLERVLSSDSARTQDGVRPDVAIWGTLEARVQGADVVILSGLNEGVWPEQPSADPWLNRAMRRDVGLLLPERQIGLAAHDYQQAVGADRVILSRSSRVDGSETVPSRWLSRLTNLLEGLPESGGREAHAEMVAQGNAFLDIAATLDAPETLPTPEARPAPAPPIALRPRKFAVTEIQPLIRDPYAIYARHILRLRALDPLAPVMDARRKGTVFHDILEEFYGPNANFDAPDVTADRLHSIAQAHLTKIVPDPATRVEWLSQLEAISGWLHEEEVKRRAEAVPLDTEVKGGWRVAGTPFELNGKADRIDRLHSGELVIYDYKTGGPPAHKTILRYDRQLVLEAVMAEAGAFKDIPAEAVSRVVHLGVGRTPKEQITKLVDANETVTVSANIADLLQAFLNPEHGYLSRRAMESLRYDGDYDHLARFGEWDASMAGQTVILT